MNHQFVLVRHKRTLHNSRQMSQQTQLSATQYRTEYYEISERLMIRDPPRRLQQEGRNIRGLWRIGTVQPLGRQRSLEINNEWKDNEEV
jgi:hypothetical protein